MALAAAGHASGNAAVSPAANAAVATHVLAASIPFVENGGQLGRDVRYRARLWNGTVDVMDDGELVYSIRGVVLRERFARSGVSPVAGAPHSARVSSFVGDDRRRHAPDLATYESIALTGVGSGIAVRLRATEGNVEKIFTLPSGADPRALEVNVAGAHRLRVDGTGALHAETPRGDIVFTRPVAWQTVEGRPVPVTVAYAVRARGTRYGFRLGAYDRTRAVTIDPLVQATYLGGASVDYLNAMVIDPATGDLIVAGATSLTNLPCPPAQGCVPGEQGTNAGGQDGFVARISADLTHVKRLTYLGGSNLDGLSAVAVHPNGDIYVAGNTLSTDLPCTTAVGTCAKGAQSANRGGADVFVSRLSADLGQLEQTTYFGGTGNEYVYGIATSPFTGYVYITGYTFSADLPCTTTATAGCANAPQPAHAADGGMADGFVAALNSSLTAFVQATYFGGGSDDLPSAIAVHPLTGDVIVAGHTTSTDIPCTAGTPSPCGNGAQPHHATVIGHLDGFILRLTPNLAFFLQATYLGGDYDEHVYALAVHPVSGDIVVAGDTASSNFPRTPGGGQQGFGGSADGYVARLSADLGQLKQSTYLGGSGNDVVTALAIHPVTGEIFAAGMTSSTNLPCVTASTFYCAAAAISTHATDSGYYHYDALVARLSADLTLLFQSTYFGGNDDEFTSAIVVDPASGAVTVGGYTYTTNLPCTTAGGVCANGLQAAHASDGPTYDGFLARFTPDLSLANAGPAPFAIPPANNAPPNTMVVSSPVHLTGLPASLPMYVEGQTVGDVCVSSTNSCACDLIGFIAGGFKMVDQQDIYVCVRQLSAPGPDMVTEARLHAGPAVGTFRAATGNVLATHCDLDVDGNGAIDALTDGLVILRALFGLTGASVTNGAVGSGAARTNWSQIGPYINTNCGTSFGP
jgi:hypothetical protein